MTFDVKRSLKMLNMTKHAKPLKCVRCDKTFLLNWKLETHLKTHKQSKKFGCVKCGKVFYDEIEDLIDHYGETAHNI